MLKELLEELRPLQAEDVPRGSRSLDGIPGIREASPAPGGSPAERVLRQDSGPGPGGRRVEAAPGEIR